MKKITDIKPVALGEVSLHLKNGWELYGHPMMAGGNAPNPFYQCMVKYADEEIEGKIVEFIDIATSFYDISTDISPVDISYNAKKHIELGYQPYGFIRRIRNNEHGRCFGFDSLAMVKYEK